MKIFAIAKILRAKRALPPAAGKFFVKFNVAICTNCVGKMLIWGHFCVIWNCCSTIIWDIWDIWTLTFGHANVQMPWYAECNQSNWRRPECFYKPESPVTTSKSGLSKLPMCDIHWSYGWTCIHVGSDKSAAQIR